MCRKCCWKEMRSPLIVELNSVRSIPAALLIDVVPLLLKIGMRMIAEGPLFAIYKTY